MTKKNKRNVTNSLQQEMKALRLANAKLKNKKRTPFGDTGEIIGSSLGTMFGMPGMKGVGKWLGSGIGSIFGSGQYTVTGQSPAYNVLNGQIPKFSTSHATNIVSHREYLGDITGTAAFTNLSYPLNPGMAQTFPWLSSIAKNYQQYRFHGLIFEFRSLITDFVTGGSPGVIVMTTNYNADDVAFISRQEAENAEYAVATKPTLNQIHMIECAETETANKLYYVRSADLPVGQDKRATDYGLTQFITQNNPVQVMGELWVSYVVELFKPVLDNPNSSANAESYHTYRTGAVAASPLGTVQVTRSGITAVIVTGTTVTVPALAGARYLMELVWTGGTASTNAFATPTITGGTLIPLLANGTLSSIQTTGTLATQSVQTTTFQVTSTFTPAVLTWAGTGTLPGTTSAEIWIHLLDSTITA
jgi:hypothetical protein